MKFARGAGPPPEEHGPAGLLVPQWTKDTPPARCPGESRWGRAAPVEGVKPGSQKRSSAPLQVSIAIVVRTIHCWRVASSAKSESGTARPVLDQLETEVNAAVKAACGAGLHILGRTAIVR
jgi:hypothetical protein